MEEHFESYGKLRNKSFPRLRDIYHKNVFLPILLQNVNLKFKKKIVTSNKLLRKYGNVTRKINNVLELTEKTSITCIYNYAGFDFFSCNCM